MDRREKLVGGIDLSSAVCAEIGALCNPLLTKAEANIKYVDYTDAATLRKHYAGNPFIDPGKIVETDAIWGDQTLLAALKQPVDFVVASHVVEHVPDLITWLNEIHSALTEQGQVRLAVPDRRFTFDFLRRETELSDVLAAYLTAPRVPQPQAILDYFLNATEIDSAAAWRGEISARTLKRPNTFEPALTKAKEALHSGVYHDAHCWVFTPHSFAVLLSQLAEHGLIKFACEAFHDTEFNSIEFFVALRASESAAENAQSWWAMADAIDAAGSAERAAQANVSGFANRLEDERKNALNLQAQLAEERLRVKQLVDEMHQAQREVRHLNDEVRLLRQSHSWKITRPLRLLSTALRVRRGE